MQQCRGLPGQRSGRVDWGTDGGKRAYGTYGEGGTGKGKIIWNVNKEYRKKISH